MTALPAPILAALFILGACAGALGIYAVARIFLARYADDDTVSLAGSVIFRVAALHGLILALVFAQEQINYTKVRGLLTTEATAVADVYYDLDRYGANTATALQASLRAYVHAARGIEWTSLADGRLSSEAWGLWDRVYRGVLDLEPQTPRETSLRNNMLQDLDRISDSRSQREVAALGTVTPLFWVAAVFGFALVVMPYFTFAPTPLHLMLLTIFAAFNGLILFVIAAMANPYAAPAALEPAAFDRLAENWEAEAEQRANPE